MEPDERPKVALDLLRMTNERGDVHEAMRQLQRHLDRFGTGFVVSAKRRGDRLGMQIHEHLSGQTVICTLQDLDIQVGRLTRVVLRGNLIEALLQPLEDEPAESVPETGSGETVLDLIAQRYTREDAPAAVKKINDLIGRSGYVQVVPVDEGRRLDLFIGAPSSGSVRIMSAGSKIAFTTGDSKTIMLSMGSATTLCGLLTRS